MCYCNFTFPLYNCHFIFLWYCFVLYYCLTCICSLCWFYRHVSGLRHLPLMFKWILSDSVARTCRLCFSARVRRRNLLTYLFRACSTWRAVAKSTNGRLFDAFWASTAPSRLSVAVPCSSPTAPSTSTATRTRSRPWRWPSTPAATAPPACWSPPDAAWCRRTRATRRRGWRSWSSSRTRCSTSVDWRYADVSDSGLTLSWIHWLFPSDWNRFFYLTIYRHRRLGPVRSASRYILTQRSSKTAKMHFLH